MASIYAHGQKPGAAPQCRSAVGWVRRAGNSRVLCDERLTPHRKHESESCFRPYPKRLIAGLLLEASSLACMGLPGSRKTIFSFGPRARKSPRLRATGQPPRRHPLADRDDSPAIRTALGYAKSRAIRKIAGSRRGNWNLGSIMGFGHRFAVASEEPLSRNRNRRESSALGACLLAMPACPQAPTPGGHPAIHQHRGGSECKACPACFPKPRKASLAFQHDMERLFPATPNPASPTNTPLNRRNFPCP